MKIAIPADEKERDTASGVCVSFGRTPYFAIYDTETGKCEFIANTAADDRGGAGIKAAQAIADAGVSVVLAPRCGENAADVLKAAGIKLYKTVPGTVSENIKAFAEGGLSPLGDIHPGFHGHE